MATITKVEEIESWQLARKLSNLIFRLTKKGSFVRDYGFKGQIKDAVGSIMDNIAEGFGRGGNKEFANMLTYAAGSANEVKSQLYRAADWKYISEEEFKESFELCEKTISKIGTFINYLNNSEYKGEKFKRN